MKLLIAYDGSECSDAALDDLHMAGLPENSEAHVISVAEVWLPPPPPNQSLSEYVKDLQTNPQPFKAWKIHAKEVADAATLAKNAEDRLRQKFPAWRISSDGDYGSPGWEIISKAEAIDADLIVVGSHGRSMVGRFFLGSISQKVLTEASCSVRVARGRVAVDPSPARLVVGFDGSLGSNAAIESVLARKWPSNSEVKIISATDPISIAEVGFGLSRPLNPAPGLQSEPWVQSMVQDSVLRLQEAGLKTEFAQVVGNPKYVIVEEAEKWAADCIYVGANRFGSRIERFLLGSVAGSVASRAHCSVEVVRTSIEQNSIAS